MASNSSERTAGPRLRANMQRVAIGALTLGVALIIVCTGPRSEAAPSRVQELINQAQDAQTAKDNAGAYKAIREAVGEPEFSALPPASQHAALELAYTSAFSARDYGQAHEFASRASVLPQQTARDWSYRLQSAFQIRDARDEALSIAGTARLSGASAQRLTAETVWRVFRDTRSAELSDARREMLLALYESHWHPEVEGETASHLWLTLGLLLLESGDSAKAFQVVTLVDAPGDVITMHVDRRYDRLLKAPHLETDVRVVAKNRVKTLRQVWARHPRSLNALLRLTYELLNSPADDKEALELTTQADLKISNAPKNAPPFDDIGDKYAWILDNKARALRHLGKFDAAAVEERRALELPHESDSVSQAINLAQSLCQLGRLDEAVEVVPKMEPASEYGRNQIVFVGVVAAAQRGDRVVLDTLLGYLSDHKDASPGTFEDALLLAGRFADAEDWMVSRLSSPEQRGSALMELQTYADSPRPAPTQAWHAELEKLKSSPKVRQALDNVGSVNQYTWRYPPLQ